MSPRPLVETRRVSLLIREPDITLAVRLSIAPSCVPAVCRPRRRAALQRRVHRWPGALAGRHPVQLRAMVGACAGRLHAARATNCWATSRRSSIRSFERDGTGPALGHAPAVDDRTSSADIRFSPRSRRRPSRCSRCPRSCCRPPRRCWPAAIAKLLVGALGDVAASCVGSACRPPAVWFGAARLSAEPVQRDAGWNIRSSNVSAWLPFAVVERRIGCWPHAPRATWRSSRCSSAS